MSDKKFKDLTGHVYGRLTVISHAYQHKVDGSYWFCSCVCTGSIRSKPYKGSSMKGGTSLSCGCLRREGMAKTRLPDHGGIYGQKYIAYKNNARGRDRVFELTLQQFISLSKQACHYCGRYGGNTASSSWDELKYNGIDRVNNALGYTLSNSVACCGKCNIAKGKLSSEEFIAMCKQISLNTRG